MGPIRGFKRRKKAEKKVDQNVLDAALSSLQPQPNSLWIGGMISLRGLLAINFTGSDGKPLSPNDQVAIALRRLSSGESLSNIGDSFGINQSTVSHITWRFVEAMEERGLHHLRWPTTEAEIEEIKSKFEKMHGLPNCCGVIDTTHIVMTLPTVDHSNDVWIDREKNHSMVLQAIVDPDMRFRDVIVGYPGSLSDALVLQNSSFFKLSEEGKRLNGKKIELMEGTELGEYIIGDAGFPLLPWLLTPFQDALPDHRAEFNKQHAATRAVAEIALARLKEMWRIIHGVMWLPDKNRLPRIVFVCCLLHNIVIDMEDKVFSEMPMSLHHDKDYRQQICESASETGIDIREKLSSTYLVNCHLEKGSALPYNLTAPSLHDNARAYDVAAEAGRLQAEVWDIGSKR
ncbi:hypothetical protein GH714_010022 [Hevea brasiliensis]|uniref:DDE Tnp4 domain-containing protein n=1 Tax=Hevea brasiliensis TaxID=3981 RepID=A0A6A6MZX2_HEVBR|nr:hypothetical protein GH714_010022 [Hevea brasiliensis]